MALARLFISFLFLGFALLTSLRAPGMWGWKLAILATEFGQFLCILPLGTAIWILASGQDRTWFFWAGLSASALAVGLFLKPAFHASSLASGLESDLSGSSQGKTRQEAFSWRQLYRIGSANTREFKTLPYAKDSLGKELLLDFYSASLLEPAVAPCVLVIHGGGWDSGSRSEIVGFNHWLASRGYAVASIEYRLAPEATWPAQLEDIRSAISFLKAKSGTLGIDGERLALFGRSAGGQIASASATELKDQGVRCVAAFYAPHDLVFAWEYGEEDDVLNSLNLLRQYMGGSPEEKPSEYRTASAYLKEAETLRSIPTLLVHGKLDTLVWVEQNRRFAKRLDSAGADYYYLEIPWATHALEYNQNGPSGQLALYALEQFLEKHLNDPR